MARRYQLPGSSSIDAMIARLPPESTRHIKKTSTDEVEMQFSLSRLTQLQKLGMGTGDAENLLVRLRPGDHGNPHGFCVHLSNERDHDNRDSHTPWLVQKNGHAPNDPYCQGIPNLISYQLSRKIWRDLEYGFVSLGESYNSIASRLPELPERCVVCGARHEVRLRRPAPCGLSQCKEAFEAANYEIHIRDIWTNGPVIDLMLTAICAAAAEEGIWSSAESFDPQHSHDTVEKVTLLKGCPIGDASTLKSLINRLPPLANFGSILFHTMMEKGEQFQLDRFMSRYIIGRPAQALQLAKTVLWTCTSYGGFLTEAAGSYRIRAFDDHPQFLLVNTAPDIEQKFAAHMRTGNGSKVLFHGTSLCRLHSILRGGLQNLSGTRLMANGAAAGRGVYMTAIPQMAYAFARNGFAPVTFTRSGKPVQLGWKNSTFETVGALLVCEVAWTKKIQPPRYRELQVAIINDPTEIIIRYVILVDRGTFGVPPEVPSAQEAIPQFENAFRKLRSGAW